jgi:tetratricopeptide (TPR) repeat protein
VQPIVDVQAQLRKGLALHQQGRLAEAERIYAEVVQRAPNHFDALHLLGVIAYQNRDYERAVQLISKAISINPKVASPYYNRGNALKGLGRLEEALVSYDEAIALEPNFSEAYSNRGSALKELGRFEEALVSCDRAIALNPGFADCHYNRGNVLKELKRFEEALVSCDRAIALNPGFADCHYNRGNVLKELKRFEEALVSYNKAITLKPDSAEAYSNRGNALRELNRLDEALASYDRAITLKPDFEDYYNRGITLKELNRFEEALASCNKAIGLKPDFAEAHYNRGIVLKGLGRLEEALLSYEKSLLLRPDFANAYNNMGSVLKQLGRLDEARAALLKAIDIDPKKSSAYFNLADLKKFAPGDPHLIAMQRLAASQEGLAENDSIELDFALSKAYADFKDHRRSFQHLLSANARKRATISYNEMTAFAQFDAIEATFTSDLIAAKSSGSDPSQRPIFILGMPRSGTTLVEQILASHPMVHGAGELATFDEIIRTIRGPDGATIPYPKFVPVLDRSMIASIGAGYLAAVNKRAPKGERVTDKMPSNYYFVGLIHLVLPNAKIIHTVRDPVDTCISCFSKLFTERNNQTYDLGELGRYYKRYESLMAHWRRVLPPGRILDVRYEDVVADLETQARRILSYCELPWDDRCLSFYETDRPVRTASATQVRQPIYSSAVGRWRVYEEFLGPLLTALDVPSAKTA